MAITIGIARITLYLDESFSLKDKRHVIRSIIQRVRNKFNVSIAEVGDLNDMRVASIVAVCVSNSSPHVDEMLARVISFIERNVEVGVLGEIDTELIHAGN
ncbi:MAG: DUF503 domain-containing protein [Thermomicrobiales bacterium]